MRTYVRAGSADDPPRRPRLLLRVGRAARRPAAAWQTGDRRRRRRARRQLRGEGARGPVRAWAGVAPAHCARRRSSCRRGSRPTSAASRAVFAIFADTAPVVEALSIDEAFLDVRGLEHIIGTPIEIAAALSARVRDEVGLAITVGLASTKFLAKVASAVAKPDGLLAIPAGGELAFLHPLPVERLWGVGRVTAGRLRAHGLDSVGQIAAAGRAGAHRSARARRRTAAVCARPQPRSADGRAAAAPPLDRRPARARARAANARRAGGDADGADRPGRAADARQAIAPAGRSCCGCASTTTRARPGRARSPRRRPGRPRCSDVARGLLAAAEPSDRCPRPDPARGRAQQPVRRRRDPARAPTRPRVRARRCDRPAPRSLRRRVDHARRTRRSRRGSVAATAGRLRTVTPDSRCRPRS